MENSQNHKIQVVFLTDLKESYKKMKITFRDFLTSENLIPNQKAKNQNEEYKIERKIMIRALSRTSKHDSISKLFPLYLLYKYLQEHYLNS